MKSHRIFAMVALLTVVLTGCSVLAPDKRPDDERLRDGINLLLRDFNSNHPKLVNWDAEIVKKQISKNLPKGFATEAGWTIQWESFTKGELPQVVVPWSMVGQYPTKFRTDANNYSGGDRVPESIRGEIKKAQLKDDFYLAGIVNLRASTQNPNWVIFTSVPYLPFTDIAYGFAHRINGRWIIDDFGTATVGCESVPTNILIEFDLSCPTDN